MDLIVMIDRTVPPAHWINYKTFILSILSSLTIDSGSIHVTVMSYDNQVRVFHNFAMEQSFSAIKNAVDDISPRENSPLLIAFSLGYVERLLNTLGLGLRPNIPTVVLLFATKASSDSDTKAITSANNIKSSPSIIVSIGITGNVNINTLFSISSPGNYFLQVPDFQNFGEYSSLAATRLCIDETDIPEQTVRPTGTIPPSQRGEFSTVFTLYKDVLQQR